MQRLLFFSLLIFIPTCILIYRFLFTTSSVVSPLSEKKIVEKPLKKYSFRELKKASFPATDITFGKVLATNNQWVSYMFYYTVVGKKVSGRITIPTKSGTYPIVVLFRGYVDKDQYSTGVGSQRMGDYLAQNGYITLAPDFLGYGESDNPSTSSIEERFQTYTSALGLFSSLQTINTALTTADVVGVKANTQRIGIWGHSNGGHIALSILAITGKSYPTALWAPVSKPFPYSVLFFTDEFEDNGKALRKVIADFEKDYNIEEYSPTNYYTWITAPIQLHQGATDESVPLRWSNVLYEALKKEEKDITYFIYPSENHNFTNGSWGIAAQRSLLFFNSFLQ